MTWQAKAGIIAGVLLLFIGLLVVLKLQYDKIQELKAGGAVVIEQKDLGNGITRAESKQLSKSELEALIKKEFPDFQLIQKDMNGLDADPNSLHVVRVVTPGFVGTNIPTTTTTPNPDPQAPTKGSTVTDKYGYFGATQWVELKEPFGDGVDVPYGRAGFSAWEENPWSLEVTKREYATTTVLGVDDNGRHYAYSRVTVTADGKTHKLPITDTKFAEELPSSKFRFNPRLYLGVQFGAVATPPAAAEVTPTLDLSLFSLGKTKSDPVWTFLAIGAGYATQTQAPVLTVSPVRYNVGDPLPLITNLHVGPGLSLDVKGNIAIYMGVFVGL